MNGIGKTINAIIIGFVFLFLVFAFSLSAYAETLDYQQIGFNGQSINSTETWISISDTVYSNDYLSTLILYSAQNITDMRADVYAFGDTVSILTTSYSSAVNTGFKTDQTFTFASGTCIDSCYIKLTSVGASSFTFWNSGAYGGYVSYLLPNNISTQIAVTLYSEIYIPPPPMPSPLPSFYAQIPFQDNLVSTSSCTNSTTSSVCLYSYISTTTKLTLPDFIVFWFNAFVIFTGVILLVSGIYIWKKIIKDIV